MGKRKTIREAFIARANKASSPSKKQYWQRKRRETNDRLNEYFAICRNMRLSLSGDGDDSFERELLELRKLTGYSFEELKSMPANECDRIVSAAIKMKRADSRSSVPTECEENHDHQESVTIGELKQMLGLSSRTVSDARAKAGITPKGRFGRFSIEECLLIVKKLNQQSRNTQKVQEFLRQVSGKPAS